MTITAGAIKVQEAGNGSDVNFSFDFKIYDETDILVYKIDASGVKTLCTLTTDYSVAINSGSPGGVVTFVVAPVLTGYSLIVLNRDIAQDAALLTNGSFPATEIEKALDQIVLLIAQLEEQIDRSLKAELEDSDPPALPELGTNVGYLYYNGSTWELKTPA